MGKRYLIDRTQLPYDAFVDDESWLIPVDEEGEDGNKRQGAETDRTQKTGGERRPQAAE